MTTPAPTRYPPPLPARLLHPRHWPLWCAFGLLYLLGWLPQRWRHRLGAGLGQLMLRHNRKRRFIAGLNIEWCFRERDAAWREGLLQRFAGYLGRSYLEFGFLWWAGRRRFLRRVEFEGLEQVQALLAAGEPVILFTLHTLGMDMGGTALSTQIPMVTFSNSMRDPLLEWMLAARRSRFGCTIFPRSGGIRPVVRALRQGRVLFFPCDEDQGTRANMETVFAPFCGNIKSTLTSPVRLARLTGARLVPCSTVFDEASGRYRVRIYAPLEGVPTDDAVHDATVLNMAFERAIREAPEQYHWGQRMFHTRPDNPKSPYG